MVNFLNFVFLNAGHILLFNEIVIVTCNWMIESIMCDFPLNQLGPLQVTSQFWLGFSIVLLFNVWQESLLSNISKGVRYFMLWNNA